MTWDICPAADAISQPYGCVDYVGEWLVDATVCPSRHFHAGVDLGHSRGGWTIFRTPVCATRAGAVVAIGTTYLGPFAVTVQAGEVFIEHGHLDEASVVLGQQVAVGEQLGLVGTQGSSTAPHLHVEVRTDGARQGNPDRYTIDPLPYLNSRITSPGGWLMALTDAEQQELLTKVREVWNVLVFNGQSGNPANAASWLNDRVQELKDAPVGVDALVHALLFNGQNPDGSDTWVAQRVREIQAAQVKSAASSKVSVSGKLDLTPAQ